MYKCILIATDGSELSQKAVDSGISLAALSGAKVIALKVVPRYPVSYFEGGMAIPVETAGAVEKQWADAAQAVVDGVKTQAQAAGVQVQAVTMMSDMVAETVVSTAQKHGCDLIVMASHGRRGINRVLMGSETMYVLTHSSVPVLILK